MGNTRRRQVRGRWAGWAAPAPCRPGTRAMGLRGAADGGQVAGGLGVREVRARDVLASREPQPHLAAREVPPPPLGGGRDGHAAPRGAPAPPVPCHVAAGEVEEGRVRPRARRPGGGLGEHGDPRAGAPARRHGEAGVPPTCCRAGSGRTTSSWPRGTGPGGAGRRGPRTGGRCSRRPGAARAGAGAARSGSSRTAGARRGGPSRRARRRGRARPRRRVARRRGGPRGLGRACPAQVRRGRARREPPRRAPRDLEPRVMGRRDLPRPVDGGAAVLRGRVLLEVLASRVRRHDGPGRRLLPGVLPPRPAARGGLRPPSPRPVRPGASGRRGEYR